MAPFPIQSILLVGVIIILLGYMIQKFNISVVQEMDRFEIDFSKVPGKTIVITGGNTGLGFETARALTKAGGRVILACRSQERCNSAKEKLLAEFPKGEVVCLPLNLASFESVREFTQLFVKRYASIDVLVNNAGVSISERILSEDGLELQMQANHLGHFYLTSLLYPFFNENSRVVSLSSGLHFLVFSKASVMNDFLSENSYSESDVYSKTKLVNLLFTFEFNRRLATAGNPKHLKAIVVHPGLTGTSMQQEKLPFLPAMKGSHGALAQIYAAVDPRAEASVNNYIGAKYIGFGIPVVSSVSSVARDEELQKFVWEISKRLTPTSFHDL